MSSDSHFKAGIDLGGSKIAAVVVSDDGVLAGRHKDETPHEGSFEPIATAMSNCLGEALVQAGLSLSDIKAVGVGVPGPVDETGSVAVMPNLDLQATPVASALESVLGRPVTVENDVNLATLAEYHFGAGKGLRSLYGIVPGTGVGGGYVIDGRIVKGSNNTAGEIGHMVVMIDGPLCGCGQRGCLEAFVSKLGFIRELRQALMEGEQSLLVDSAEADLESVNGDDLRRAWDEEDKLVRRLLTEQARILGVAVANVINLTGVDGIVIGGGVYESLGGVLLTVVEATADQHAIGGGMQGVRLTLAELKEDAVARGAVLVAVQAEASP